MSPRQSVVLSGPQFTHPHNGGGGTASLKSARESPWLRAVTTTSHRVALRSESPPLPWKKSRKTQDSGLSWKRDPGWGQGRLLRLGIGPLDWDTMLSGYLSSLPQGDICLPQCDRDIMGPLERPTMPRSPGCVFFAAPPAEPAAHTAKPGGETAASPRRRLIPQNGSALRSSQSVREAGAGSDSHRPCVSVPDDDYSNRSQRSSMRARPRAKHRTARVLSRRLSKGL